MTGWGAELTRGVCVQRFWGVGRGCLRRRLDVVILPKIDSAEGSGNDSSLCK